MTGQQIVAQHSYLIFKIENLLYGVPTTCVKEIFWLPELTPIEEAPEYVVGVVNMRGKIIPVMDINLRFEHARRRYYLTDMVLVLDTTEDFWIGLIVNQVFDVVSIDPNDIKTARRNGLPKSNHLIAQQATLDDKIIMLIDPDNLIRGDFFDEDLKDELAEIDDETETIKHKFTNPNIFCPEATPEEREIFQRRAQELRLVVESHDLKGLTPVAVVGLNSEYFGFPLEVVREFADVTAITVIPCCPPHIIGCMNLRGEILTLLDISGALNMNYLSVTGTTKVVVTGVDSLQVGILVDQILEITYVDESKMRSIPVAVQSISEGYLKGTAPFRGKMMALIDVPKLLIKGELIVDEKV